ALRPPIRGDQPVTPPSDPREPRARSQNGRRAASLRRRRRAPPAEPGSRRARVDVACSVAGTGLPRDIAERVVAAGPSDAETGARSPRSVRTPSRQRPHGRFGLSRGGTCGRIVDGITWIAFVRGEGGRASGDVSYRASRSSGSS